MVTRRSFLKYTGGTALTLFAFNKLGIAEAIAQIPGGDLDPLLVPKFQTPLLVHTTTNDEDVNVLEVEHLIEALKAAGKKFEYRIYQDAPGGHAFNRLDTPLARESRREIYAFLAKYLKPTVTSTQ